MTDPGRINVLCTCQDKRKHIGYLLRRHGEKLIVRAEDTKAEGRTVLINASAKWGFSADREVVYTLRCKSCRFNLPARGPKLEAAYDTLTQHGATEVELRVLAAIVRKQ